MEPQEMRFFHKDNELIITNATKERIEKAERRTINELFRSLCNSNRRLGSIQVEIILSSFISAPQIKTANIFLSIPERGFYSFAHYQKANSSYGLLIDLLLEWASSPEILEEIIDFFNPEGIEEEIKEERTQKKRKSNSPLPHLDMNELMNEIERDRKNK